MVIYNSREKKKKRQRTDNKRKKRKKKKEKKKEKRKRKKKKKKKKEKKKKRKKEGKEKKKEKKNKKKKNFTCSVTGYVGGGDNAWRLPLNDWVRIALYVDRNCGTQSFVYRYIWIDVCLIYGKEGNKIQKIA